MSTGDRGSAAFAWRAGTRFRVPADVVHDAVLKIEAEAGVCSPAALVEAGRPDDSEIHDLWLWDDKVEAQQRREDVARRAMHSIVRVEVKTEERVPVLVSVTRTVAGETKRGYVPIEVAMAKPSERQQVCAEALALLRGVRRRFGYLSELAEVWRAIDDIE